ncbi:MAG: hypothetical protein AAGJ93_00655 [Bacteroidota bacterium]
MQRFSALYFLLLLSVLFAACNENEPEPDPSWAMQVAGDYIGDLVETTSTSMSTRQGQLTATVVSDEEVAIAIDYILAEDMTFTITRTTNNNFNIEPFDYGTNNTTLYGTGTYEEDKVLNMAFTFDNPPSTYSLIYSGQRE